MFRKGKQRQAERNAARDIELLELRGIRDDYDKFHRWAAVHAPATLRRYELSGDGRKLPAWKLSMLEQADRAMKDAYGPAIREAINNDMAWLAKLDDGDE